MGIKERLLKIQTELKAPKGQYNSFGRYNYRNCEDILEALKPLCKAHNTVLTIKDDIVQIGERYYVKATVTLSCVEADKTDEISATAFAREEESKKGMDGSQITGASSSYARKYALNGLFNIDDTKDSDSTNKGETDKPTPKADKPAPKTDKPVNKKLQIDTDLHLAGVDIQNLAKYFGVTLDKLTDEMKTMALKQKRKEISLQELEEYKQDLNYDS